MTSKVIEGHKSSSNFSVNPTLTLMDCMLMLPSQIVCISLSLTLHLVLYSPLFLSLSISFSIPLSFSHSLSISLSTSLFCSMQTLIYILKGYLRPLLCRVILNDFQIFYQITTLTYSNLNLRSYGQLF